MASREGISDIPGGVAPSDVVHTTTETTATSHTEGQSWLSGHLRNIMALSITGVVCYLALRGNEQAQAALIATFAVLAGAIWGERASLKNPHREG